MNTHRYNTIRITIKDPRDDTYYHYAATPRWADAHDNGALISCGLTVDEAGSSGKPYLSAATFDRMKKAGEVKQIANEEWKHSGCQSSCVLRGNKRCSW